MGLPFASGVAGPAAGVAGRAAAGAAAGAAPPSRFAGAAGWWGGCIWRGFHRDSRRAGLQWNHTLVKVNFSSSPLAQRTTPTDTQKWNLKQRGRGSPGHWSLCQCEGLTVYDPSG